ncbi:MAG: cation transporter [Erysipelotrichaceae bacterium]|nr:cation transporter [Erysipelotrichaceae bacterium]MBQ1482655.1 cation transporter [Erysipelotrichaceae bacterium]
MFELLCKIFIKDHENTEDEKVREKYGTFFSVFSIFCNILMVIFKLIVSFVSNSVSIRADALNNLSDVGSNLASYFGFALSGKHPDADHPYGHGRMEYVSGMVVSFLILLVGFSSIRDSLEKILHPETISFSYLSLFVLFFSIALKLFMSYINSKAGDKISSETLKAAAADSLNDSIMTSATLLSLIIFRVSGINIDAYIGLAVSFFVVYAGIGIFRNVLDTILGKAPDREEISKIEEDIRSHEGILGIHDLLLHDYGPSHRFMSLHAEVDSSVPIMETHDLIDNIELEILNKYKILTTIHMDPIDTKDEEMVKLKEKVKQIVTSIDKDYNIHDFRIVRGPTHSNLVFDVLIPAQDRISHETLKKEISDKVSEIDKSYRCVIQIDHSFV